MTLDPEIEARIEEPASADAIREARLSPSEAVEHMRIRLPDRGNRKLRRVLERANADRCSRAGGTSRTSTPSSAWQINDHSWVHIQIVANIALKLLRQLTKHGVEPSLVRDYGMKNEDAEVVVVLAALTHCVGMSVHRTWPRGLEPLPCRAEAAGAARRDLRRARPHGDRLRGAAGDHEPPRRRRAARRSRPGILRVADALDMAKGRSRIPFETRPGVDALAVRRRGRGGPRSRTARRSRSASRS